MLRSCHKRVVTLESDTITDQEWREESKVTVEIIDKATNETTISMVFEVESFDDHGILNFLLGTSISFVQVK